MMNKIWNITQLDLYIKDKLCNDYILQNITVQGEVMNLRIHNSSGHWYFSLKDKDSQIKCTMFRFANAKANFKPNNGDLIIAVGCVDFYNPNGDVTFNIKSIEMSGIGNFYVQFENTKRKLEPLGYFAIENKKKIPQYPNTISIVTGQGTAALKDVLNTLAKRWPVKVKLVPALVQGKEAINSIVNALKEADKQNSDVILLVRGGGSIDDLWCFNDETIAKTIFECHTPVVTGIGHEIDTTIADLVADKRAITPTAAAVAVTADASEIINKLNVYQDKLIKVLLDKLNNYQMQIDQNSFILENYLRNFENQVYQVDDVISKMKFALYTRINQTQNYVNKFEIDLSTNIKDKINYTNKIISKHSENINLAVLSKVNKTSTNLQILLHNLNNSINNLMLVKENNFINVVNVLDSISPLKTIARGYIVSKQEQHIIKSIKDIDYTKPLSLTYKDGEIEAMPLRKE